MNEDRILESLDGLNKAMKPVMTILAEIDYFQHASVKVLVFIIFPITSFACLYCSYNSSADSFKSSIYLELSSGIFFFSVAPIIMKHGQHKRRLIASLGVAISIIFLAIAFFAKEIFTRSQVDTLEFYQSSFIEFSIAILILVILELTVMPWLDIVNKHVHEAKSILDEYKN